MGGGVGVGLPYSESLPSLSFHTVAKLDAHSQPQFLGQYIK